MIDGASRCTDFAWFTRNRSVVSPSSVQQQLSFHGAWIDKNSGKNATTLIEQQQRYTHHHSRSRCTPARTTGTAEAG